MIVINDSKARNKRFLLLWYALIALVVGCGQIQNERAFRLSTEPSEKFVMPQLGVQLWSVKESLASEFEGTLRSLAGMGFTGVEFAGKFGEYGEDPAALRSILESLGLRGSGAHLSFENLNAEHFEHTVRFYKILGVTTLIIGWDERAWHPEKVDELVTELNELAEKLNQQDMVIGYHNHQYEFDDFKGTTYWDYIAQNTRQDVVLQLDVAWAVYAGKDPVTYVTRYPGRTLTTHYKVIPREGSESRSPIIGEDDLDWLALSKTNVEVGGAQWLVVEQETVPEGVTPLEAVHASKQGLDRILSGQY